MRERETERERERERERVSERETDRERERDRQTDRQRGVLIPFLLLWATVNATTFEQTAQNELLNSLRTARDFFFSSIKTKNIQ